MLQTSEIQMNAIRRYELALVPVQRIDLPSSSKILNVQVENDIPYLHVIIYNPKTSLRKREIITATIDDCLDVGPFEWVTYLGSYKAKEEPFNRFVFLLEDSSSYVQLPSNTF
jgi:hypothetical protein